MRITARVMWSLLTFCWRSKICWLRIQCGSPTQLEAGTSAVDLR